MGTRFLADSLHCVGVLVGVVASGRVLYLEALVDSGIPLRIKTPKLWHVSIEKHAFQLVEFIGRGLPGTLLLGAYPSMELPRIRVVESLRRLVVVFDSREIHEEFV